jgi:hypothetical protein
VESSLETRSMSLPKPGRLLGREKKEQAACYTNLRGRMLLALRLAYFFDSALAALIASDLSIPFLRSISVCARTEIGSMSA